jgi:hypothetical protein
MTTAETMNNRILIGFQAVGSDLKLAASGAVNLIGKEKSIGKRAPSEMPGQNHFGVTLESNPTVGISERIFIYAEFLLGFFLAMDESPYLIGLHVENRHVFNLAFKESLAPLATKDQQTEQRITMNASQSLNGTNRVAFNKKLKTENSFAERESHSIKRLVSRFKGNLETGFATIPLNAFFVLAELFALSRTVMTRHCELAFFPAMAHNVFAELQREQSRLVFNKGSGVSST